MITLRPYQQSFVHAINAALSEHRRVVAVGATGMGKAVVLAWYATKVVEKGRRILFVTNRRILVDQLGNQCRTYGIPFGTIMADLPTNLEAPVQVASIQTLQRRGWQDLPEASWVAIDEAHQAPAAYNELYQKYSGAIWLGMTATPVGPNGRTLIGPVWKKWIEPICNTQLIRDGFVLRTHCVAPFEPDLAGSAEKPVKFTGGEYNRKWLADKMGAMLVHADVFKWWQPYSELPTVCFVPKLAFARGFRDQIRERGYTAEIISAETERNERRHLFERFKSGELRWLLSVSVLKEGWDCVECRVGVDLQPNYQFREFWQKLGRIRRPMAGKDQAIWLDFAGNVWRHIHPDEDPEWPVDDKTSTRDLIRKQKEQTEPGKTWRCSACSYVLSPWEKPTPGPNGPACPNCGQPIRHAVRRIMMGTGRMRTVTAAQRKKKIANDDVRIWFGCLYPAVHSGKQLNLARIFFKQRTGRWPDKEKLPFCPDKDSGDWSRRAADVYPNLLTKRKKQS